MNKEKLEKVFSNKDCEGLPESVCSSPEHTDLVHYFCVSGGHLNHKEGEPKK